LFNNPVGYRGLKSDTSLAKCFAFLLLFSGSCSKTEVFKQLYLKTRGDRSMEIQQSSIAGTMESSDIMITVEPGSGKIEIELESIVEKQFGGEIHRAILETLEEMEITNARIRAVDKGALDCVIRARVKTAVHRASGGGSGEWRAPL
jgi:citrate lyase subunit gamma (acyl carrier protein)